mmetsp:Transcript_5930/g.22516  ORF Transcript_5930/g.22516 Transcript_5930/m.22516 type:complete len:88 (-) Transcript_5930:61-324(-)
MGASNDTRITITAQRSYTSTSPDKILIKDGTRRIPVVVSYNRGMSHRGTNSVPIHNKCTTLVAIHRYEHPEGCNQIRCLSSLFLLFL